MTGKKRTKRVFRFAVSLLLAIVFCLVSLPVGAQEDLKPQILVDQALVTLNNFVAAADMEWFTKHLKEAKGVFIVPQLLKAGFIFGGSGGRGVVLLRDEKTGRWGEPAFYSIGSVCFGLQIGGESSEVVMQIRTQGGVESLYGSSFKLGGDTSIALGPVGAGAAGKGVTADLVSFSRAQGAFAGLALDGSVIKVNDDFNKDYYGKEVRPTDILVKKDVSNPGAARLREGLYKAAGGK